MCEKDRDYKIVPLGCNCLVRTVLTRGGVKPSKKDGELSYPFDLVSHSLPNIIKYLKDDFYGYTDDLFFVIKKRNFLDFRNKGLWQKPDGTRFFHDKDCGRNDLEKITTRINNRINNFRELIKSETPILFVVHTIRDGEYIDELYKTLSELCPNKHFELAVLDFNNTVTNYSSNIHLLQMTKPTPNFNRYWNRKLYRNSKVGKYVEENICSFVQNIIDRKFK